MSFVQRLITVAIQLAPNPGTNQPATFAGTSSDTATISGLRTSVRIKNSGSPVHQSADVKVWGLTPSLMNQLATLGLVWDLVPRNSMTIQVGQADARGFPTNMSTVFQGTMWESYGDYSAQPDVPFHFTCVAGAADAAISVKASSFPGSSDVASVMSGLARQMNLGFRNFGVNAKQQNLYLRGSAKQQADKLATMANITWGYVQGGAVMGIWPKGGNADTPSVPTIGVDTGMIGYPAYTQQGIIVKSVFDPRLSFGSLFKVRSSVLSGISGALAARAAPIPFPTQWAVSKLDLALDSLLPKGEWSATVYGYNPGKANTILPPP